MGFIFGILGLIAKVWPLIQGLLPKKPVISPEAVQAGNAAAARADANVAEATAQTEAAMAQAAVDAPKTQGATVKALQDGTF